MLNDCFGDKPLTFQMPRNDVNFEVALLSTLTQRYCVRKVDFRRKMKINIPNGLNIGR